MMVKLQVASKPTLDEVLSIVNNESYGLSTLIQTINDTTPNDTASADLSQLSDMLDSFIESLTNNYVTESDFLQMVAKGMRPRVGSVVSLQNTQTTTELWVVADRNHDGVYGTVDLVPYNSGIVIKDFDDSNSPYPTSDIRTWLITTFKSGFSTDIQNILKPMSVYTNTTTGNTTSDKVKLLSALEVHLTSETEGLNKEGASYPLFSSDKYRIRFDKTNDLYAPKQWWLRTPSETDTNTCVVNTDGTLSDVVSFNNSSVLVVPCIRI